MRRLGTLSLIVAVCWISDGWTEEPDPACYYPDIQQTMQSSSGMASRSVLEARVVYVYFPPPTVEQTDSILPAWADSVQGEVHTFNWIMSRHQQNLKLRICKRLGADSTKAWRANFTASHYESTTTGWEQLNKEVMLKIHNTYRNAGIDTLYWNTVNLALVMTYENTFNAHWGAIAQLSFLGPLIDVPGFQEQHRGGDNKRGVSLRLASFDNFAVIFNDRVPAVLSHELGHVLFDRDHSPFSGNPPTGTAPACEQFYETYVNMGKYDTEPVNDFETVIT